MIDYQLCLQTYLPGTSWSMNGNDYDSLVFYDGTPKPSQAQFQTWQNQINADAITFNRTSAIPICFSCNVDGTKTGGVHLFTPAANFVPMNTRLQLLGVSGLTLVATISLGTNGSSYTNMCGATLLTGLSVLNNLLNITMASPVAMIPANTDVYANISIASTATTYALRATVMGYYA